MPRRWNEATRSGVQLSGILEIIGEAAARIQTGAPEFVARHRELPWTDMCGMRNKMIHEHFDIDWDIIWTTVKVDLPQLEKLIDGLLIGIRQPRDNQ